jgi:hypothetical protein
VCAACLAFAGCRKEASAEATGIARAEKQLRRVRLKEGDRESDLECTREAKSGVTVVQCAGRLHNIGLGVSTVIVDSDGRSYGHHGEHDFADFVRARGWLADPPAADVFQQLYSVAESDGWLACGDAAIESSTTGLVFACTVHFHNTPETERLSVHVGSSGAHRTERQ